MDKQSTRPSEHSEYDSHFLAGIGCLEQSDYQRAREHFLTAVCENEPSDVHYFTYASYLELSAILSDYKDGSIQYCCHSSETILPIEPEIQINLACSEFIKGNRKLGIQALDKMKEFKLSEASSRTIDAVYDLVGKRKKDPQGQLTRKHFLHKSLGKLFRRKSASARQIEGFIKETVKNRYGDYLVT